MTQFNEADTVYVGTSGWGGTIRSTQVTRTTATQAIIETPGGREQRFRRDTGLEVGGGRARLRHPTPQLDRQHRLEQGRVLAGIVESAALRVRRGDDDSEGLLRAAYERWDRFMNQIGES